MESEGAAFVHLLLAEKVVYEEDALEYFNDVLDKVKKRIVEDFDELMELLAEHHHSISKFGFQVKLLPDPLGRTSQHSGMFFSVVNTEKDKPIQAALALPIRKEGRSSSTQ